MGCRPYPRIHSGDGDSFGNDGGDDCADWMLADISAESIAVMVTGVADVGGGGGDGDGGDVVIGVVDGREQAGA